MTFDHKALAVTLALAVPAVGLAEPQPAPMERMGGMMGNGMSEEMQEEHLKKKQDFMLKMHVFMNKILTAKDDKEREALKADMRKAMKAHMEAEHQAMRQHMQQMMQHHGPMQSGGGMQHGAPGGGTPAPEGGAPASPPPPSPNP
ncbi:hypothetical protein [Candidatus Methylocalor cossyra]|uniref:Uncharacterized protein n=1 Tax=Candidatus Methylocalor cossyra TaxID=3108543 RepID=A0ABP1C6M7_9GAMM